MNKLWIFTLALSAELSSWVTLVAVEKCLFAGAQASRFAGNIVRGRGEPVNNDHAPLQPRPRIINGVNVEELRYPYFSLMYGRSLCGGVLIGPRLVLSAAHCKGAADRFRIGAFEGAKDGQPVSIRSTIVHPDYDKTRFDNDIMIFQLEDTAGYPYITLEKEKISEGEFTVVGFGDTDKGSPLQLSDELQEVELEYVDNDKCDYGHGDKGDVTKDMMCVAGKNKDSCIGDSGGPLIRKGSSFEEDKLVGVVSWGRGCAEEGVPGVYARISYFYDWIVATVCENFPDDAPSYMKCKVRDWSMIRDRPAREPTRAPERALTRAPVEAPTKEQTANPIESPTKVPTTEPVPIISPFPSDATTNQTDVPTILEKVELISWQASELQECQGDCDNDDDCIGDLVCFQRNNKTEESFGCSGYELFTQNVDVCIDPIFLP